MDLRQLYRNASTSDRPVTGVLMKGSSSKLLGIGLGKGVLLKEHKAPGPTKLVVIKGAIEYMSGDKTLLFEPLDSYSIPLEEVHSVKALKDSVFILSIHN